MPVLGTSSTGTASAGIVHSVTPEQYGATGNDSTHDDAPAIEAAIAAAVAACIADSSYVCEVVFAAEKTYYAKRAPVANPTINGVSAYSYAQIALPYVGWDWAAPNATPLVTLTLRSAVSREASNTSFNAQPCTIATTPTSGGGYSAGNGIPSVIGGPARSGPTTPKQWNGINLVIDGVNILSPANPQFSGLDAGKVNTVQIGRMKIYVATNGYTPPTYCTVPGSWGVIFPGNQNGGIIEADDLSVYGYFTGISLPEHLNANNVLLYWNRIGVGLDQQGDHESYIQYLQSSNNNYLFGKTGGTTNTILDCATGSPALVVGLIGGEFSVTAMDAGNALNVSGHIAVNGGGTVTSTDGGGRNIRLVDIYKPRGAISAPTLPTSGTVTTNPYGRDVNIFISGGSVSTIAIDGTTTGLTSGSFILPLGRTITVTYSAAPTWQWTLF